MKNRYLVYTKGPMKGYKVDRLFFLVIFLLIVSYLGVVMVIDGFSWNNGNKYVSCPENAVGGRCYNPLFNNSLCGDEYWCSFETIPSGTTFGKQPSVYFLAAPYVAFFGVIFFVLVNHFLYNRGFKGESISDNSED